jgi:hypothetical protein
MTAMAQSVAISDDGSVADGSAILEVKSQLRDSYHHVWLRSKRRYYSCSSRLTDLVHWLCSTAAMYFTRWVVYWRNWITPEQQLQLQITLKKGITTEQTAIIDNTRGSNTGWPELCQVWRSSSNDEISAATSTKITYDAKGLVTAGADATTTDDIAASTDKKNM